MANYKDKMTAIAKAVHHDYAGGQDRKAMDKAGVYVNMMVQTYVKGNLNTATFVSIVNQFLGEYADRNLRVVARPDDTYQPGHVGFYVRRSGDALYVTEVMGETRLKVGDKITRINRRPVEVYARGCGNWLYGRTPERELWGGLLMMQWNVTVQAADGTETELELRHYPLPQEENASVTFRMLADGVGCLRVNRMQSAAATQAVLDANADALRGCERLVLDLRRVHLGNEEGWFPLYALLLQSPARLSETLGERALWRNYTEGNCKLLGRQYRQYLDGADDATAALITQLIEELHQKVDTGFVREAAEPLDEEEDRLLTPWPNLQKVLLLTDTYCENDAEDFVQRAAAFEKVTTVGRATMGTLDYTDLVALPVDENITLIYPMSKSDAAMQGQGIHQVGLAPDVYVPWTPEECARDVVLEKALEL
jgi:hypothetical protein